MKTMLGTKFDDACMDGWFVYSKIKINYKVPYIDREGCNIGWPWI